MNDRIPQGWQDVVDAAKTPVIFTPSEHQTRAINWVRTGKGSAVVISVAGSGKTKLIELCLPEIPENCHVQLFSFNNPIAKELNVRIDKLRADTGKEYRNLRASTFHSVGGYAVAKRLGKRSVRELNTDGRKCQKICDQFISPVTQAIYGEFICKLVGYAKGVGIGAITPDIDDAWYNLIQFHDLFLDSEDASEHEAIELARELLELSNKAALDGNIDFDDMLYLPLLWKLRLWQNDWVIVDEAQDTSPVRRALAKLALRPGGRSMWVGDPRQSIYVFTGASHDAMDIIKREFNAIELPLTVSYRCPRSVAELVQHNVSYFEVPENAKEGRVLRLTLEEALKELGPHDAILCRNTAPLIEAAYQLIARGVGCVVLGREIGTNLINLVKKMKAHDIDGLIQRLNVYRDREVAKFTARGEEAKAEAVSDRVACIEIMIDFLDENIRTIPILINKIENLFSDTNGALMLGTGHKAKGREWQKVAILRPELIPSKWARQQHQIQQEMNLKYVMDTRALDTLIYLTGGLAPQKKEKQHE